MAAAGLWTTASDLARFVIQIQKSYQRAIKGVPTRPEKQNYALGFSITERDGVKQFSHGGTDAGFQARLWATVDGSGLVVLTNSENGGRLASEIALAVGAVHGWLDKPKERDAVALPPEALVKFAGEYDAARIGRVKIRVETDHLVLTAATLGEVALYPHSPNTFFSSGGVPDLVFAVDGSSFTGGNVTATRVK